jgi:hypothetical protein
MTAGSDTRFSLGRSSRWTTSCAMEEQPCTAQEPFVEKIRDFPDAACGRAA